MLVYTCSGSHTFTAMRIAPHGACAKCASPFFVCRASSPITTAADTLLQANKLLSMHANTTHFMFVLFGSKNRRVDDWNLDALTRKNRFKSNSSQKPKKGGSAKGNNRWLHARWVNKAQVEHGTLKKKTNGRKRGHLVTGRNVASESWHLRNAPNVMKWWQRGVIREIKRGTRYPPCTHLQILRCFFRFFFFKEKKKCHNIK